MGTMLLDDLKVLKVLKILKILKVLKQAHIEQIRSNCFEANRYYPLWIWLEGMSWMLWMLWISWMWYLDLDHLFFVIVDKLAYLLLLEWLEWLEWIEWIEMAHVIPLPRCIRLLFVDCWLLIVNCWLLIVNCWLLIAVPKIRRLRHPCILASVYLCILNSNVISLDFIHLFIIYADWLLIQFKFIFHIAYIHLHSLTFTYIQFIHLHSKPLVACNLNLVLQRKMSLMQVTDMILQPLHSFDFLLELLFCFQFRFRFRFRFHHPDVPFCFFDLILK
jgi:hypothetical protein